MKVLEMVPAHTARLSQIGTTDLDAHRESIENSIHHRIALSWKKPLVKFRKKRKQHPDFCWLDDSCEFPLFSQNAVDALGEVMRSDGELLPVDCEGTTFHVFHALKVADYIDWNLSQVTRNEYGDVEEFVDYVFDHSLLEGIGLFRILYKIKNPHAYVSRFASAELFATDAFFDAWNEAGLTNADFDEPS